MVRVTLGAATQGIFLLGCSAEQARAICRQSLAALQWRVLSDDTESVTATPTGVLGYGVMRIQEFIGAAYPPRVSFRFLPIAPQKSKVHMQLQWGKTNFFRGPESLVRDNWAKLLSALVMVAKSQGVGVAAVG